MKLPEKSSKRIIDELAKDSLLDDAAATEVVDSLENDKPVNWNIVLTKQYQSEKKTVDETHS